MATPPVGNDPKVRRITATYYPVPVRMAHRITLMERIRQALSKESK
jgi:hypothetical protein